MDSSSLPHDMESSKKKSNEQITSAVYETMRLQQQTLQILDLKTAAGSTKRRSIEKQSVKKQPVQNKVVGSRNVTKHSQDHLPKNEDDVSSVINVIVYLWKKKLIIMKIAITNPIIIMTMTTSVTVICHMLKVMMAVISAIQ